MHVLVGGQLAHDRGAEKAPAAALRGPGLLRVLALHAHREVLGAADVGLVDAQPEVALPCREDRAHDLLRLYHLLEQREVVHLSNKQGTRACKTTAQGEGWRGRRLFRVLGYRV